MYCCSSELGWEHHLGFPDWGWVRHLWKTRRTDTPLQRRHTCPSDNIPKETRETKVRVGSTGECVPFSLHPSHGASKSLLPLMLTYTKQSTVTVHTKCKPYSHFDSLSYFVLVFPKQEKKMTENRIYLQTLIFFDDIIKFGILLLYISYLCLRIRKQTVERIMEKV